MTGGMKFLIVMIVVMGIAIMVALALVAYGIVAGVGNKNAMEGFGAHSLAMPPGCHLAEARLEEEQLVVRLGGEGANCQTVVLIDPETGKEEGRLTFIPAPPQ